MRNLIFVVGLSVILGAGCNQTRWNLLKGPEKAPPTGKVPTVPELVSYLNDNAGRIKTMRVGKLDLDCQEGSQPISLDGNLVLQTPRSFRMAGKTLGNTEVDLGSNDQEFWFWVRQMDPRQFYCSYKDFAEGRVRSLPLPFQPDWVIETFGLGSYGPPEKYQLDVGPDVLKLVEKTRTPQGVSVRKVIVFRRRPVQPPNPQVTDYLLLDDASGREICSAHIRDTQLDPGTQAILPKRIELRWPEKKLKLAMKLNGVATNQALPATVFVRQPLRDFPSVNLAQAFQEASLQPVGGVGRP